jgi:hypothetical protein
MCCTSDQLTNQLKSFASMNLSKASPKFVSAR